MNLLSFGTAAEFQAAAEAWLASAERENNPLLTAVAAARHDGPSRGWMIASDEGPQLALFQSPPHYVLLSRGIIEAARWAAEILDTDLPGVFGPVDLARAFAAGWSERTGRLTVLNGEMTFFTLERVTPFRRPKGSLRAAIEKDFDGLMPIAIAAASEMNLPKPEQDPEQVHKGLRRAIAEARQFVWADGSSIRATASYVGALARGGARIRGVYTPPEFRGRGYGTAVTGSLAEWLLAGGQDWVSLFADNANPVSTEIYRRLGFQAGCVYRSVRFY
jgi:hypothetical protein